MSQKSKIYNNYIKRFFDFIFAIILTVLLSPLLLLVLILVKIDEPGAKAIFKQQRCGYKGESFTIYKFRSMYSHAPTNLATEELPENHNYMSKLGKFIRSTSLDELPQLINIIKGEMSFIGPRPVIFEEKSLIKLRKENNIYELRPGITGYAQTYGRDTVRIKEKVYYDKYYMDNVSLILDFKLIFLTFYVVFSRKGNNDQI